MARTTFALLAALAIALMVPGLAPRAADPAPDGTLSDTSGFERAYGASFYAFDACGGSLTGRLFRGVLLEKFARCPFSSEARDRFARRAKAQGAKSSRAIRDMILAHGGLPVRLEGMPMTCHEFMTSADYQRLRAALDLHVREQSDPVTILPGSCDAAEISP